MVYTPPPERPPSEREPLGFDDFLAIFIAFTGIGAIFAWGISQTNPGFDLSFLPRMAPVVSPLPNQEALPASPSIVPLVPAPQSSVPVVEPSPGPSVTAIPVPVRPGQIRQTEFSDVPSDYWAKPFIVPLVDRGIMTGFPDGTLRPNQPVTRAEFSSLIGKAFNASSQSTTVPYGDISQQFWARDAISQVDQLGFMTGYPDNTFRPNQAIPKVEALIALATGLQLPIPPNPTAVLSTFQDAGEIPAYAREKVAAATQAGLVVNYPNPNVLSPNQALTRANAAALIYQAMVHSDKAEAVDSQYIVRPKP